MTRLPIGFSAVLGVLLLAACQEAPTENPPSNDAQLLHFSGEMAALSNHHGTSFLEPSSDTTTIFLTSEEVGSYVIDAEAEFWVNFTTSGGLQPGSEWQRTIEWRTDCGSTSSGHQLHYASTPLFPDETYNLSYTQEASFSPGVFGEYEIESTSVVVSCGSFGCSDDTVPDAVCVVLERDPSEVTVTVNGPFTLDLYQTGRYYAYAQGGTSPYTYDWRRQDCPSGSGSCYPWGPWYSTGDQNYWDVIVYSCGVARIKIEGRATDSAGASGAGPWETFIDNPQPC